MNGLKIIRIRCNLSINRKQTVSDVLLRRQMVCFLPYFKKRTKKTEKGRPRHCYAVSLNTSYLQKNPPEKLLMSFPGGK